MNEAELDNYLQILPSKDRYGKTFGILISDDTAKEVCKVYPDNDKFFTIDEISLYINNPIDKINFKGNLVMITTKNNTDLTLPFNTKATFIYGMPFDSIYGNALICSLDSMS